MKVRAAFWDTAQFQQGQPVATRLQPITYCELSATLGLAYEVTLAGSAIQRHYGGWPPH